MYGLGGPGAEAEPLSELAAWLPAKQQAGVLAEALRAAGANQYESSRADALIAVAARLPSDQPELLAEALRVAGTIQDEWRRASALIAVAARLPAMQQTGVLAEALRAAGAIQHERS